MSNYFVKVFTDEFNEEEWENLKPEEIHYINFKGKRYDEVRHGRWIGADDDGVMHKCSICGEWSCCRSPYCGECGAKMDEVTE